MRQEATVAKQRIDRDFESRLAQSVAEVRLNTKPAEPTNDRVQSWYPYYAGYSIEFAKGILNATGEDSLYVLDPWNGSGTTTRAGIALGHRVSGFDINPVAVLVSAAKLANPEDAAHISGFVARTSNGQPSFRAKKNDPLLNWLPYAVVSRYRAIERTIINELATDCEGIAISPAHASLPPLAAFLTLGLMRSAKRLALVKRTSNPTWLRPSGEIRAATGKELAHLWEDTIHDMASDLCGSQNKSGGHGSVSLGSSTMLPIDEATIDLIVTSPPYCTRIDYFVGTAFEMAALGISEGSDFFGQLRRSAMGTNLSRGQPESLIPSNWPESVQSLLASIRQHPSKASDSYYLKTYVQYFDDCLQSLSEMHRVLKANGAAIVVVQSSYYKDIHVDLPELYVACGKSVGLRGKITSSMKVTRALTQINSRSRKHLEERGYRESVIVFEKRP